MTEGKCFSCGAKENLNILARYKNGNIQYTCRPCNSMRTKRYYDKRKVMVFEHYGKACVCCSENMLDFLTIDHKNNDGNNERWASGNRITGVHLYQKIIKSNYPDTYQTLCMNCNFGKRMNKGICPHKTQVL